MKTLEQVLSQTKKYDLAPLLHLWMIDEQKKDVSLRRALGERLRDPIVARFVWEHLTADERLVLYNVIGAYSRNWIERVALPKKTQLPQARLAQAIDSLKTRLLLFEEEAYVQGNYVYNQWYAPFGSTGANKKEKVPILYTLSEWTQLLYTTGREIFLLPSDRSSLPLNKILTPYDQDSLFQLATNYQMDINSFGYPSKPALRSMVVEEILQPELISFAVKQLDEPSRKFFEWVYAQGGKITMKAAREHLGGDDASILTLLHSLANFVLVLDTFSENVHVVFIPQEMYAILKRFRTMPQPEVVPPGLVILDAPPALIHPGETQILYDLAILIGAVYQQTIEPTQVGQVPKRIAVKLKPLLHGQFRENFPQDDYVYMEMLLRNARKLGLLQLSESPLQDIKEHYEPGPQLESWAQMNTLEQTKSFLSEIVKSFDWQDELGVNYIVWNPYTWNPQGKRVTLLKHLNDCAPGKWYSIKSLVDTIWHEDPFALRTTRVAAASFKTTAQREKWNACEGETYIGVLASTFYRLGLVALGYEHPELHKEGKPVNPDAFMVTDLGATAISLLTKNIITPPTAHQLNGNRSLIVQPNFELLLLQPDMPTLYSVLPFAQVNQVSVVSRLTLTKNSLLRGAAAGLSIERILQTLEVRSQKEVPQNVAYTLRDWLKNYKDIKLSQVILLEVASESIADEICASPKLQLPGLRRIGPCAMVVSNDANATDLRRTLEKEGIVVRISGNILTTRNRYGFTSGMLR